MKPTWHAWRAAAAALLTLLLAHAAANGTAPPAAPPAQGYQPLAFLVDHCWKGTFPGGQVTDEHCFSWIYGGKFVRDEVVRRPIAAAGSEGAMTPMRSSRNSSRATAGCRRSACRCTG